MKNTFLDWHSSVTIQGLRQGFMQIQGLFKDLPQFKAFSRQARLRDGIVQATAKLGLEWNASPRTSKTMNCINWGMRLKLNIKLATTWTSPVESTHRELSLKWSHFWFRWTVQDLEVLLVSSNSPLAVKQLSSFQNHLMILNTPSFEMTLPAVNLPPFSCVRCCFWTLILHLAFHCCFLLKQLRCHLQRYDVSPQRKFHLVFIPTPFRICKEKLLASYCPHGSFPTGE